MTGHHNSLEESEQYDFVRQHVIVKGQIPDAGQVINNDHTQAFDTDHHQEHIFPVLQGSCDHGVEHKAYGHNTPGQQQPFQITEVPGRYEHGDQQQYGTYCLGGFHYRFRHRIIDRVRHIPQQIIVHQRGGRKLQLQHNLIRQARSCNGNQLLPMRQDIHKGGDAEQTQIQCNSPARPHFREHQQEQGQRKKSKKRRPVYKQGEFPVLQNGGLVAEDHRLNNTAGRIAVIRYLHNNLQLVSVHGRKSHIRDVIASALRRRCCRNSTASDLLAVQKNLAGRPDIQCTQAVYNRLAARN
ncbi:hypothetical protein D3C73_999350 [compost metagenome]